jgi:hypothetical protein
LSGKNNNPVLLLIRKPIQEIHNDFNTLEVTEMIPCKCSECKGSPSPHFYKYQALKRRLDKGKRMVECEKSYEDVSVVSLLDGVGSSHSASLQLVRDFIAKGLVAQGLDAMEQYAQQLNNRQLQDEVIVWKSTFQENERARLAIDNGEYTRKRTQIVTTILDALKRFDD